jgi:hypothetical protein
MAAGRRGIPSSQIETLLFVAAEAARGRIGVDEAEERGLRPSAIAACCRGVTDAADRVVDDQIFGANVGDAGLIPAASVVTARVGYSVVGDGVGLDRVVGADGPKDTPADYGLRWNQSHDDA